MQHLHDENKRLRLLIDEQKGKIKVSTVLAPKRVMPEERKHLVTEFKCEDKVYDLLRENEQLKRKLLGSRVNETALKKRKSVHDRSSFFIEKKLIDYEHMYQRKA